MWLPTLVSTLFLAEAIWRFVDEGDTVEQRASAIFNGVNTIIFALLGFACLVAIHRRSLSMWLSSCM